ncbi:MAG TPA: hypothetical protein DCL38_03200 [Lachnospiraceae bacterium]|nr:hypothetical protein [Lachnospiraceae bacterium]
MNVEDRKFLDRINKYAEKVLGDIDPQKTPVSLQLEKLKPEMERIAGETGEALDDIFIRYMDLASEAGAEAERKLKEELGPDLDLDLGGE